MRTLDVSDGCGGFSDVYRNFKRQLSRSILRGCKTTVNRFGVFCRQNVHAYNIVLNSARQIHNIVA